ncbi:formyl-CoA transferase [Enhydrobacter aerosaccus]|uniref:Formyl-CoA transferase n=1 Tax=Enhydrobacter aerosaccus TaxID=225324 RepID=A0A1T4PIM5_9HYPH|nr:CaiB/BaiF CoA-transferase family protein [Enhydrobacter aerosaccus]SJZ91322.1 formyl-CoA transferase [Enhydrobacter aerosaccus]
MTEELPLAGLRVLDISSFIAAPAAAVALADFGADVIKVEPPGEGDPHRHNYKSPNYPRAPKQVNFPWQLDGRLKRSLALDLKNEQARPVLERLIARADVMIVNFPPPARERLKLRWEDVEPTNPRLVYCSLTGYGETGPDRDRPGFDITAYFGRSGILDAARYEGGPPGLSLPAQGDRATAMTLVAAILLGLRQRDRTGKGCWVGTSLYANGVWANGTSAAGALVGATLPPRLPPDKPRNALTNLYRTKDDRWLQLLMVRDDRLWAPFCQLVGRDDLLADPRFADREERKTRAAELFQELAPLFASKTYAEWEQLLSSTGIPFGVIGRLSDVIDDPQAEHAGIFADTANPEVPRTVNNPIRLGFAKPRLSGLPPDVGQHNEEVLRELAYSEADIAALKRAGALG